MNLSELQDEFFYNSIGIGEIGNDYGSLSIVKYNGKYYWDIGSNGEFSPEEIPEYLYNALIQFENER